jgi:hypothetical protein
MINYTTNSACSSNQVILLNRNGKWSFHRSPVPRLLAAKVSTQLWEETFDQAVLHQEEFIKAQKGLQSQKAQSKTILYASIGISCISLIIIAIFLGPYYFAPSLCLFIVGCILTVCCNACWTLKSHDQLTSQCRSKIRAWTTFVGEQQPRFQPIGVARTAKSQRESPTTTPPKRVFIVGGLGFSVMGEDEPVTVVTTSLLEATTSNPQRRCLVADLESLKGLLTQGLLTQAEFQQAKAKIWQDHDMVESQYTTVVAETQAIPMEVEEQSAAEEEDKWFYQKSWF